MTLFVAIQLFLGLCALAAVVRQAQDTENATDLQAIRVRQETKY